MPVAERALVDVAPAHRLAAALVESLGRVVRGRPDEVRLAAVAVLAGGHVLIEGVPGQGKTLLASALARSVGGAFARVQGTSDLLPSEITGVSVYSKQAEAWAFRPGPVFANVVLVDELNRATPRAQSALLEAMEERQVSVDGVARPLPDPFVVVATQNPFDHAGTFPLVEGQRDRFLLVLQLGHPGRLAERELLLGVGGTAHLDEVVPVTSPDELASAVALTRHVRCSPPVADYVVELGAATRSHPDVVLGASPRAALAMVAAARAVAVTEGRPFVTPDDVKAVAVPVLAHRLVLTGGPDLTAASTLVHGLLERVPIPRS